MLLDSGSRCLRFCCCCVATVTSASVAPGQRLPLPPLQLLLCSYCHLRLGGSQAAAAAGTVSTVILPTSTTAASVRLSCWGRHPMRVRGAVPTEAVVLADATSAHERRGPAGTGCITVAAVITFGVVAAGPAAGNVVPPSGRSPLHQSPLFLGICCSHHPCSSWPTVVTAAVPSGPEQLPPPMSPVPDDSLRCRLCCSRKACVTGPVLRKNTAGG